ncbi:ETC complex I subunit [Hyphococcus flavus]|uniref:ETC complex I subunit n=1 Tax=Hyphococcus flavus TaxID=1866326 RepID=A0AAF0CGU9_9PROT|nr:ETC complex I subunit [Hyphococcus flavus]WDI31137.1 ETC complex I subunit [Hyphococcus flavus]
MFARIFKPSKTAMQSGRANTERWVLEVEAETARRVDPLMGWTSGDSVTSGQLQLKFNSQEEAVAYAEKHGLAFRVDEPHLSTPQPKAYSDNFAFHRRKPWTH